MTLRKQIENGCRKTMILFAVLLCLLCPVLSAQAETADSQSEKDRYVTFVELHDDDKWYYRIEDVLKQEREYGSVFSPAAEELIEDCDILLYEDEHMTITVQQTLFDCVGGYINFCFSSNWYILRPFTCLDIYSPWYQPGDTYHQPVCFIQVELHNGFTHYTELEGLSEDQKQFNLIPSVSPYPNGYFSPRDEVPLKVTLHYFDSGEDHIDTIECSVPIHILENIDECHMEEPIIHEDFNLAVRGLKMVITPLRTSITPMYLDRVDYSKELLYLWALIDQDKHQIVGWYNLAYGRFISSGMYISAIPEPIYYIVYQEVEPGKGRIVYKKQLVRDGDIWTLQ